MKITLIAGTHRVESESGRAAVYMADRLQQLAPGTETALIDLGKNPLPFWDEGIRGNSSAVDWKAVWGPYATTLGSSDGFVVLSPEYHGMVPAALKNFFLFVADGSMAHKPGLIVGVSASKGGAFPVAELRASSYKNSRVNWLPEHILLRDAGKMLHGAEPASTDDIYIRARIDYALKLLLEYAKALGAVRASGVIDTKTYPNGMS